VDARSEIREFLTSRRAKIAPEQAGLRTYGGQRRVPGLRREEVALLAGVSAGYYTRLERGNASGVSESVLEALARALQLDEAERAHLFDLARAAGSTPRRRRRPAPQWVRPSVQSILDAITGAPAFVRNGRLDILAANRLGRAFYAEHFDSPHGHPNSARFIFLDARATDFYVDWEQVATDAVAILRSEAGRDPYDRDLSELVGELSTRSETFRTRWAAHNVRFHDTGSKRFQHPVVGDLSLTFETMKLAADVGCCCSSTPPNPARSPRRHSTSSRVGRPRSTRPSRRT
jgi:transcriptional regulator with XRE-family HTH domain